MTQLNKNNIFWTSDHENILVDWADKAMCYKWLHSKSNIKYSRLNSWFTIPVIIMSTLIIRSVTIIYLSPFCALSHSHVCVLSISC